MSFHFVILVCDYITVYSSSSLNILPLCVKHAYTAVHITIITIIKIKAKVSVAFILYFLFVAFCRYLFAITDVLQHSTRNADNTFHRYSLKFLDIADSSTSLDCTYFSGKTR